MFVLLAIVAAILVLAVTALARHRARLRRDSVVERPTYRTNQHHLHALADWAAACEKSLQWSRTRRMKGK